MPKVLAQHEAFPLVTLLLVTVVTGKIQKLRSGLPKEDLLSNSSLFNQIMASAPTEALLLYMSHTTRACLNFPNIRKHPPETKGEGGAVIMYTG